MTPTLNGSHRERLASLRARKTAAREAMSGQRRALQEARDAGDHDAAAALETALAQTQGDLSYTTDLESVLLHQVAGLGSGGGLRDSFLESPDTLRELEGLASSSVPIGRMNLGLAMGRDDLVGMIESGGWGQPKLAATGDVTIPDTARLGPYAGVIPQLRRRIRLLDLIPSSPMDGHGFDFTQEQGSFDTAAETAEGATKPAGDLTLTDAQVVAKTIAHWFKLKRQQLSDVPALGTVVQNRLTYGVLRRLENQLVAGDGTGDNLTGILSTSGIASVAFAAGTALSDLSLSGITDVLLSDAEPDGVLLNPTDVQSMLVAKATGSGERLDSEGAFGAMPQTFWGLPLIASRVVPVGTALVGDWAHGATLFVREGVNVRISDSDQDDFIKNQVTMLGEGRFGLAIWQPGCFARVHLA